MAFSAVARRVVSGQGWGGVNSQTTFAKGATWFSCEGHGGVVVEASRFSAQAVAAFEAAGMTASGLDGTKVVVGEEDCGYASVFFADDTLRVAANEKFSGAQTAAEVADAVKNWDPDFYTALTGEPVTAEESYVVSKRAFEKENEGNYVVRSAYGDWHEAVPKGKVGVVATRKSDGDEAHFLVPADEYDARQGSFVVDTAKHTKVEGW